MRAPWRKRVVIAAIGSTLLSGCILFPQFWPPGELETRTIVVDNRTDADWIVELRSDLPAMFAVPAGEVGTVESWGAELGSLVLLDTECDEVDQLEPTTETAAIAIEEPGTLTPADGPVASELQPFAEYWGCDTGFSVGEPQAEAPLPGATAATGTILFYGEDALPYRFDPVAGAVEPAFAEDAGGYYDLGHAWSPDGTEVVYTTSTEDSAASNLYLAAADGTDAELIVEDAMSPRWSPQGDRIAYQDADPFARNPGIWVLELETDERVLVADGAASPAWSPDGTRLAYVSAGPLSSVAEPGPIEVHVVNADGTDDRKIGEAPPFSPAPAWSPDGTAVAFASLADGASFELFTYESTIASYDLAADALATVAAIDGATLAEPAWSPDGSRIAFTVSKFDVFAGDGFTGVVDAEGGEIDELGGFPSAFVSTPTWSPDGRWIVAAEQGGVAEFGATLVALDASGEGEPVRLATAVLHVIAWQAGEAP